MRVASLSALLLAFVAVLAGCADETIVLASIPVNDAGAPAPPMKCAVPSTCLNGYYCALSSCEAPTGTCELPPAACDSDENPVCGCDHISYFNDCLRRASGVPASAPGPCQEFGIPCGGLGFNCPAGTLCAQLGGSNHGSCDHLVPGTCWVIPASCATTAPTDFWDSCTGPGGACLDTCSAIRAGGAYRRSQHCP